MIRLIVLAFHDIFLNSGMLSVKLIIAFLYSNEELFESVKNSCENVWGDCDFVSEKYDFNMTDYYQNEMGASLLRRFISFEKLIHPDELAEIKILCNLIEKQYSQENNRQINIDPGYMDRDKLVLASVKYGRQKISIGKNIWADPVLYYYKKNFQAMDWTFPDFKTQRYDNELKLIRNLYKKKLRQ